MVTGYCANIVCFVFAVCRVEASLDLPYRGYYGVGIGDEGEVVVVSWDTPRDLYKYKHEAGSFSLLWRKSRPQTVQEDCSPCVAPGGDMFLHSDGLRKHHRYTAQLQDMEEAYEGWLQACLTQQRRAVRKQRDDR